MAKDSQKDSQERILKSVCAHCNIACGIKIRVEGSQVVKVEGDPECPLSQGLLCPKGQSSLELLYHPERLKKPLKRMGERGEGKWQTISWDEALDRVADALAKARDREGARSVAFMRGAAKGLQDDFFTRFANLFGSPNITSMAHVCFHPRRNGSYITYGFFGIPDFEYPPNCIMIWGANVAESLHHVFARILKARAQGAKLIVVDPKRIQGVEQADLWLKPRPGSDLALALGMIHVIVEENLFQRDFVEKWTVGFNELKEHVQQYDPAKVANITWIPAETIREAARLFAHLRPACIQWGNSLDQGVNSFQTARALCILRALTGNLEVPGGEVKWSKLPLNKKSPELGLPHRISKEIREQRITTNEKLLPFIFYALPQGIIRAILEEDPYPVRVAFLQGSNGLLTYMNARRFYEALQKLDFLAVSDIFMTPTAAMADIVLPVATYLEFDSIMTPPYTMPVAMVQQQACRVGESRSDFEILRDLAGRLGHGDDFWDKEEEALNFLLEPAGITFDEFRKIGVIKGSKQYRSYEAKGFETPSGKVEIYSQQLEEWGFDPLPTYCEPPESPLSAPEHEKNYPLVFTSGKSIAYRHSGGRQIASLREKHPEPITVIHPETAAKLGISEGDWVYIETKRGKIKQRARFSDDMDRRVVWVDPCWWFPEEGPDNMYGWEKSNINIITDDRPPFNREMGSLNTRGVMCKVYKSEGEQ